ncbi:hypothetical protein ABZ926_30890 [Streptomyces litmocidini]|uniref:hypothetical protein n=1 Tax=Streptomyces litmocidini TaxID=67318 RepID=UPI00340FF0D8
MASSREQDAVAREGEACAAEHLALEHLDPVDVAFDGTGVAGQDKANDDGVTVAADQGRRQGEKYAAPTQDGEVRGSRSA